MTRWDFLTCPFGPDYCCHYCIFPTRYLLYPPLSLTLAFEVCLPGFMLIVAAPVDFVLGLTLIVATPQTPISISVKCWVVFFIKTIASYIPNYIAMYFAFTSLYTDNINIFRLVFCQNFCKITLNGCLFCCKFLMNVEEIHS